MRFFSQTQDNVLRRQRTNVIGVDDCAICDPSGKGGSILGSKTQSVADVGAQTVRPDQEIGFVADLCLAAHQSDRNETPINLKADDLRAERQFDARLLVNRVDECALQIRAMNNQIRRAPAAFGALQRHPHKFSVIGTSKHDDGLGPRGKRQHAF